MKIEKIPISAVPPPLKPHSVKPSADQALDPLHLHQPNKGLTERTLFHEPWWLDATTDSNWEAAIVKTGNETIAEMPYSVTKKSRLWRVSYLPPLTRTLGPIIRRQAANAGGSDWLHRLDVTRQLIAQLPDCAHFHQLADPCASNAEAAAFRLAGYNVSVQFTLRLSPDADEESAWSRLRWNTRNRIRRSSERFLVQEIEKVDTFVDFYDANLSARRLENEYGSEVMRRVLREVSARRAGTIIGSFDHDGSLCAATALVWDRFNLYYLLTTRQATSHSGAVALLVWEAMKIARERKLDLDFDGTSTAGILQFLAGFGGRLIHRYQFEKIGAVFAICRGIRSRSRERATRRSEPSKSERSSATNRTHS
ncbi:hypothetical protein BurMR1_0765 [Burkholderia sp. MR1]|nr:hypothetical protein BurMR1_0765 [Burkholderia sp. MR1]